MNLTNNYIRKQLRIYPILKGEIDTLAEMIEAYKLMDVEYVVMPGTGDRVQGGESQGVEEHCIRRLEYIAQLERELSDKWIIYRGIHTYIASVIPGSLEESIINMRYLQRQPMNWYKIARKLNYGMDWVRHKDCEIVEDIAKRCILRQKK